MKTSLPLTTAKETAETGESKSFATLLGGVLVVQVGGALVFPFARFGLAIIEPYTFAFYRFVISSLFLLALVALRKSGPPIERKDYFRIVRLGFLIIPFNQLTFLIGQSMTAAGHGAFLFATTPVFIFILAIIHLKEKVKWRRALGIAIALSGVFIIMFSGTVHSGSNYLLGDLIVLVAVIAWAYYIVLGKDMARKYGALRVTAYALASGTALYFPFGLYRAIQFDYSQTTVAAWGSVLYLALVLSGIVYVVYYWLLKYMDATRLAVYQNLQPILATIVAGMFLGEAITSTFVVGGAIVLAGVVTSEL